MSITLISSLKSGIETCYNEHKMKDILVKLCDEKTNKKLFSQALKAVSIDSKEETYYIEGNDIDVSLFSSYSNEIQLLKDGNKTFHYQILDEMKDGDVSFHLYNSYRKRILFVTSSDNNFDAFLKLNQAYQKEFVIFENDKNILSQCGFSSNPLFKGERKVEDVFYDETTLALVSKEFLSFFDSMLQSVSNYFFKRYEAKNSSKGGFLSNLSKNLFSWGESKEENTATLYDDLASKFSIVHNGDDFYLILKEGNTPVSYMIAIRFFLSLISGELNLNSKK